MLTNTRLNDYVHWGRFGNQMFLIASCIGIAVRNKMPFYFPSWDYQRFFKHELPRYYGQPFGMKTINEVSTYYNEYNLDPKNSYDMRGYFQSWKYFDHCKEYIEHHLDMELPEPNDKCALHVRRGDYLGFRGVFPILSETDYYVKAIKEYGSGQKFLIFSDDIEWCYKHFKGPMFEFYHGNNEIDDFVMMRSCAHQIIANSSFSWWAAWLNKNQWKKVVAPARYVLTEEHVEDRIPKEWRIIDYGNQ